MAIKEKFEIDARKGINELDSIIDRLQKTGKQAGLTEKEIKEMTQQIKKGGVDSRKSLKSTEDGLGNLGKVAKNVGGLLAGAFVLDVIMAWGGEIVNITGEFQKFEAVLTNTLGSKGLAQQSLALIRQVAKDSNFTVRELTDAYVKLANRGIRPTQDELVRLNDIANSTGKSIDQLVEAQLDAMTGEFERLKEFGIRAQSEGNRVIFTFKGVTTEVTKSDKAIKDYILSLGELEGVKGATSAISKTLTGRISVMQDAFDQLFITIGQGNSGPLAFFIEQITNATTAVNGFLQTELQEEQEKIAESFTKLKKEYEDVTSVEGMTALIGQLGEKINDQSEEWEQLNDIRVRLVNESKGLLNIFGDEKDKIENLEKQQQELRISTAAYNRLVQDLTLSLKQLNQEQDQAAKKAQETAKVQLEALQAFLGQLREELDESLKEGELDYSKIFFPEDIEAPVEFKNVLDELMALANEESEAVIAAEDAKQAAILATIEAKRQSLQTFAGLASAFGAILGEEGREIGQFISTVLNAVDQVFAIQQQQLQASKALALQKAQEGISQSASLPFPANIGAIAATITALSGGIGAVKALFGRNQFADGIEEIKQGSGTKDDVPSLLMRGERVVDKQTNKQLRGISNKELPTAAAIYKAMKGSGISKQKALDPNVLKMAFEAALKGQKKKEYSFVFDKNGFSESVKEGLSTTTYLGNRFK